LLSYDDDFPNLGKAFTAQDLYNYSTLLCTWKMVYKRYIKRGDKLFGPYYYKSYRDENGRARTKLVKNPQENKKLFSKLPYLIVFLLILTTGFFILNKNLEEKLSLIGFGVSDSENSPAQSEETEIEINNEIFPPLPPPEIIEEIIENNTSLEIQTSNESSPEPENVTAQNISEQISENTSLINESTILQQNNFTIDESTIQYSAKLGQPVKWKKTLKFDAGANETLNNLEVTLPKTAGEVSVRKISANESVEELEVNVKNEKIISETEPVISITGQFVKNQEKKNIFSKIFKFFRNFFSLVGKVIDIGENENEVLVSIQEELEDEDEIEIEYYTEAPYSEEVVFNEAHKEINVVGSEEIHYTNILAFSNLSKEVSSKNEIKFYWIKNNSKFLTDFTAYDSNENGKLDYIEWIVPSLSNQTYELNVISKA